MLWTRIIKENGLEWSLLHLWRRCMEREAKVNDALFIVLAHG